MIELREGLSVQIRRRPRVRHLVLGFERAPRVLVRPRNRRFRYCGPPVSVPLEEIVGVDVGWENDPANVTWERVLGVAVLPRLPGIFLLTEGRGMPPEVMADVDAQE